MIRFTIVVLVAASALFVWQRGELEKLRSHSIEVGIQRQKLAKTTEPAGIEQVPPAKATPFDPKRVVDEIVALIKAENEESQRAFMELVLSLKPEQIAELHAELLASDQIDQQERESIASMLVITLVDLESPEVAADLAVAAPNAEQILSYVFELWGQNDPAAARLWLDSARNSGKIEVGFLSDELETAVARGLALTDPIGAFQGSLGQQNEISQDLLQHIIEQLKTKEQRKEFSTLLDDLPSGKRKTFGWRWLGKNLLEKGSFQEAIALTKKAQLTPEDRNTFALALATEKIDDQTKSRADWLIAESTELHLKANIEKLIDSWTRADFNGAAKWIGDLDPSPIRDAAVAAFAPLVAKEDPAGAHKWSLTIEDAETQQEVREKVERKWLKTNPEEAAAAIGDSKR